ncbi:MAG: hypothetical protein A2X61_07065 [Ignavibacteria bacterium GWB2_35_12]|nr:MAG: hypothetical protein A2X61_07065 [Ignavibacteria bacterium GWB2_35_12]OGU88227.1 MAG: hypothetical protein A2220_14620 [Ignavibacteria bacterium RIFOXYA2_FULL_35_10]OGV23262.1 MAG: hypothetical protein A2475_13490 [Ignavibacteria bacterium RIFOXYC2_FULL_35_21]
MKTNIFKVFQYYRDKSEFIKQLSGDEFDWKFVINFCIYIIVLLFIYGFVIGIYHGLSQSVSSGIKLFSLFILSLLICFPTFYVIQIIIGSRIKLINLIAIILSGAMLSSWILVAFIPIVIFFMITGGNYYFLQLLHIAIMAFASIFGMKLIIEALKYNCENEDIYPKTGVTIFRIWIVIFLFVSIQLGWNLRPFMSKHTEKFQIFRQYEGNFYTAILYSFDKITNPQKEEKQEERLPDENDSLNIEKLKLYK